MGDIRRGYVDVPGGQVHYRVSGDAAGVPIVMFHQTASSSVMFESVMRLLPARRCVALDSPGFGGSTPVSPVTIAAWAVSLGGALDAMGIETMDVVGHHTGAAVALAVSLGRLDRVRRIVLGGPPLLSAETRARVLARITELEPLADGSHLLDAWRRSWHYAPNGPIDLVQRETLLLLTSHAPHLAVRAVIEFDFGAALSQINRPLLLVAGLADPIIEGVQGTAAMVPSASISLIPRAGVHVFDEEPAAVAEAIGAFLGAEAPRPADG